jgi:uncharacterized BrkB/YihY/UPF0761 family membrane protein
MSFISAYKIDILLVLFTIGFIIAIASTYIVYRTISLYVQSPKQLKQKDE